jgi:8-oxo-dGTP pyrophosphatase MutT (NUDIX family)
MPEISQRIAAKALIVNSDGKVLILREAQAYKDATNKGKYDVPGGRLEPGEPFLEALVREVKEETGLRVRPEGPVHVDEWRPVIRGVENQIVGMFIVCRPRTETVVLGADHDEYQWISADEADSYRLLPAVKAALQAWSKRNQRPWGRFAAVAVTVIGVAALLAWAGRRKG